MATAESALGRIEKQQTIECVRSEIKLIRKEIEADRVTRGKLREYSIRLSDQGEARVNETVTGIPVGSNLAIRKVPGAHASAGARFVIDHVPTGCRVACVPKLKLAKLIALEIDRNAEEGFGSSDVEEALHGVSQKLKDWMAMVRFDEVFTPFDSFLESAS